eukprot:TRINITY_DN6853_c0_g1_i3.p1 TRINITY_DN6853_c0_g1~~TRINITY_DN6853_c0_g1_i3.p1  ORF type:complete len:155 (-),score=56.69 TRINITY_DN6853_c0_g1_i3:63-527(-)
MIRHAYQHSKDEEAELEVYLSDEEKEPEIIRSRSIELTEKRKSVEVNEPEIYKASDVSGITAEERAEQEQARLSKFLGKDLKLLEEEEAKKKQKQEEELLAQKTKEKVDERLREWQRKKGEEEWKNKQEDFHLDRNNSVKKKDAADKLLNLLGL